MKVCGEWSYAWRDHAEQDDLAMANLSRSEGHAGVLFSEAGQLVVEEGVEPSVSSDARFTAG